MGCVHLPQRFDGQEIERFGDGHCDILVTSLSGRLSENSASGRNYGSKLGQLLYYKVNRQGNHHNVIVRSSSSLIREIFHTDQRLYWSKGKHKNGNVFWS
jgi:hypothetical protein